jgi:hypothetical protein
LIGALGVLEVFEALEVLGVFEVVDLVGALDVVDVIGVLGIGSSVPSTPPTELNFVGALVVAGALLVVLSGFAAVVGVELVAVGAFTGVLPESVVAAVEGFTGTRASDGAFSIASVDGASAGAEAASGVAPTEGVLALTGGRGTGCGTSFGLASPLTGDCVASGATGAADVVCGGIGSVPVRGGVWRA